MINELYIKIIVIIIGYLFLLATSGKLVIYIISKVSKEKIPGKKD